ncbi:MAG: hypothetical protein MI920_08030 [Kiloniellales bacterium]|nr:hypothetical protein [Kiloniellales bacterium]
MPLNIISNFAANVAHRNLAMSDAGASGSVAKISAGTRVLAARDDAAALAIGSRLRSEVAAMQQASVNAGQAISMLQIADGAMSRINDTLIRMKSLSVQAGSDQLGSVERGLIDTEFQQLLLEVDRIATDTEFNGQSLINGGTLNTLIQASDAGTDGFSKIAFDNTVVNESVFQYSYTASTEVLSVTKTAVDGTTVNTPTDIVTNQQATHNLSFAFADGSEAEDAFTYNYAQGTQQLTVTNLRTAETATVDITDSFNAAFGSTVNTIATGQTLDVNFASLGVTVTLNDGFDRTVALSDQATAVAEGSAGSMGVDLANASFAYNTSGTNGATSTALANIISAAANDADLSFDASTGILTFAVVADMAGTDTTFNAITGISFNGMGSNTAVAIADGNAMTVSITETGTGTILGTITADFTAQENNTADTITLDLGALIRNVQTNTSGTNETVQIDLTDNLDAVAGTGQNLSFDQTLDVDVSQFGVTLTLDKGFDRTSDITTTTGTTVDNSTSVNASSDSFTASSGFLTADVYDALLALGFNATTGIGYNANTGILTLGTSEATNAVTLDGLTGIRYDNGVSGEASVDVNGGANTIALGLVLADGSTVDIGDYTATFANGQPDGSTGTIGIQLGRGVFYNSVNANAASTDFTFKIGTGNNAEDRITLSLDSVNAQALAINGIDVTTAAKADASSTSITAAIDSLNTARASVGAFQNRLEIATNNLATATENTEAARSALLDLDVAREMTTFTSKQILVQAGVSMLAQANQLPQNLLRLLQ